MATLGDIAIGLKMDSSKFSAGAQGARKDVGLLGKVFGSVTGQIASLATGALGVFSVFKAATWGGSMALEAEKSSIAFEVMLGSASKAEKMLKDIEDYAARTPYEMAGTREAAQLLLNYGVSANQIMPVLGNLGDIAMGDAEKLHRLAVAFGQSSSAGRLMGQERLQMINAGFNPLQEISKRTGESMAQLTKRMEDGGIATKEVTRAFQDATSSGGRFYKMTERQSQTTAGLFSTLKDNVALALRDVATALMGGFDIKGLFKNLIGETDDFRKNLADWIPTFTAIGGWARSTFDIIATNLSGVIGAAIEVLKWLDPIVSQFHAWGSVAGVLLTVASYFLPLGLGLRVTILALRLLTTHWDRVAAIARSALASISAGLGRMGAAITRAFAPVKKTLGGIADVVIGVVGQAFNWLAEKADYWSPVFVEACHVVGAAALAFVHLTVAGFLKVWEWARMVGDFFSGDWSSIWSEIKLTADGFFILAQQGFQNLLAWAAAIAPALVEAWNWIAEVAIATWTVIGDSFGGVFAFIGETVGAVFTQISETITATWSSLTTFVMAGADNWRDAILEWEITAEFCFSHFGEVAGLVFVQAGLAGVRFFAETAHFFTGVIPELLSWFGDNWHDVFFTAFDLVATMFINLGENIRSIWAEIWDFIKSGGTGDFKVNWKPLTEGMANAIKSAPNIPDRVKGQLEQDLERDAGLMQQNTGENFNKFREERLNDLKKAKPENAAGVGPLFFAQDESDATKEMAKRALKKPDLKTAAGVGEVKPPTDYGSNTVKAETLKNSGAISVGSKDYFASIFQRMDGGKRLEKHAASTAKTSQETATAVKQINQRDKQPPKVVENFAK